ncbi:MAG: 3-methylmercaptopropionyl-CoA ligase [Steroidobacteraceae bacterium]|nr:3-methylmercaptopropionyl-CoA ligase [Steroidobacteraceae bacterium]
MPGLMQDWPLTLDRFLEHAQRWHGAREVVTRSIEGPIVRSDYATIHRRARQLSQALLEAGIGYEDRVATLGFNTARHLEAWYGIMGIGAVCHTLNPRLPAAQLEYIVNHAADRLLLADPCFAPLVAQLRPRCPSVERVVYLTDAAHLPAGADGPDYEDWIAGRSGECRWGDLPEETAAGLCYTSGTTGDPKGVLYSHRSNYLHTLTAMLPDALNLSSSDSVLAIVPMFHANAWGLAFAVPAVGAKFVLPGARLDGASIFELMETEGVTLSAGVPTVWQGLLQYLDKEKLRPTTLKRIVSGGAACPEALLRAYQEKFGIEVRHAWGMTEMSPLGTVNVPRDLTMPPVAQGRVPFGIDMALADDEGRSVPHDGRTFGHLKVRGCAVARRYFRREQESLLDADGYFDTGDVATIDPGGMMQITDRAKDVIKSGGEWISSIEIENAAVAHPKAALAAVIGVPHVKWGERPLLIVQLKPGESATAQDFLDFLAGRIARWWIPDAVQFVEAIPLGATGKIDKKQLRAALGGG